MQCFTNSTTASIKISIITMSRSWSPLQSNIASVRSRNMFWTGLGPCVAFPLLFWFISYKPHFVSVAKKERNWHYCEHQLNILRCQTVTACMLHFHHIKKLANSNLTEAYIESLIWLGQVQITDVPEPVPVHLWLYHTITNNYQHVLCSANCYAVEKYSLVICNLYALDQLSPRDALL